MISIDDGLVQERRNSIASALELHLSSTNPSTSRFEHLVRICFLTFYELNLFFIVRKTKICIYNLCHSLPLKNDGLTFLMVNIMAANDLVIH